MIENFSSDYEVCNCRKVKVGDIEKAILENGAKTLGDIQDLTTAGTDCRRCIFPEGDMGKVKKKIYCKDILNKLKRQK